MYIEFKNITKKFGKTEVLRDVNFSLEKGDIAGFQGRNGSGKTVLFKLLTGLLKPSGGEILIDNSPLGNDFLQNCGMIIETPGFIPHYSGYKNLKILDSVSPVQSGKEEIKRLMDMFELKSGNLAVSKYSLGMRQKLGIIQALLGNPEILILDEPINSLDTKTSEFVIRKLIEINAERQTTILIASHIGEDLAKICTRRFSLSDNTLIENG
ncbi:MAG: ABC transporter ATP-binding protein [Ruminococcus sp.]|jgi:ABC-2 type transport system ATP-binding protein|nr:ABC transporter ATP-binding protein [Ruminococcus sp.]